MSPDMMVPGPDPTPEPATPLTLEPDPVTPEPDDIEDPQMPQETLAAITPPPTWQEHQALLQGFLGALMPKMEEHIHQYTRDAMQCIEDMHGFMKQQLAVEKEKIQHTETVLDRLVTQVATQGLQVHQDPYEIMVRAMSPGGFFVAFTLRKATVEAVMDELPAMLAWLTEQRYTSVEVLV